MPREKKKTLSEIAYEELKAKIMAMPSNSHISARNAASELKMSYTPVREALLRLHQEGYLKQIPNVGFLVEATDISDHIKFYQVRECVEPFVLERVFHLITPELIEQMKCYVRKQEESLTNNNIKSFVDNDILMHRILFDVYDNRYLTDFYCNLRSNFSMRSFHINRVGQPGAIEEHKELIAALEAGDKERALEAVYRHISNTRERLFYDYI